MTMRTHLQEESKDDETQGIALLVTPDLLGELSLDLVDLLALGAAQRCDLAAGRCELHNVLLSLRVEDTLAVVCLHKPVVVVEQVVEHTLDDVVGRVQVRDKECLVCGFLKKVSQPPPFKQGRVNLHS